MSRSTSLGLSSSSVLAASVVCGKCSALWVIFTTASARRRKWGELFCGRVEDLGGKINLKTAGTVHISPLGAAGLSAVWAPAESEWRREEELRGRGGVGEGGRGGPPGRRPIRTDSASGQSSLA